jgi:hypothetical protein
MGKEDKIVGHKTFSDGQGGFRHEPVTRAEADAMWAEVEANKAKRAATMPTEKDARNAMFDAWFRLKELGWQEAIYCAKDGSEFYVIEPGSSGVHVCHYEGKWPKGTWWIHSEGDMWPSRPCLWKPID